MPDTTAPAPIPVLDLFRLNGRAAIVTGAARGLGKALSIALAEAGADIVAIDIGDLDDVAAQVRARGGPLRGPRRRSERPDPPNGDRADLVESRPTRPDRHPGQQRRPDPPRTRDGNDSLRLVGRSGSEPDDTVPAVAGLRPGRPRRGNPGQRHQHRIGQLVPGRL